LLAAQAFALGLTTAWIAIPASAIFLESYGSGLLPLTYIGAAVAGAAASASLSVALRRRPLVSVAVAILAGLAVVLVASWFLLWKAGADWVSFGLLVLVPIIVPVGFMLIVAQAGMLLDVRSLKAFYGRVIAGFALGFVTGGVTGPLLLTAFGRTEDLLAAAAASAVMFMIIVTATRRSFPMELSVVEAASPQVERLTLRTLLRHRYVVLILGFQMLSAVESQWLDYLVFDRAGQRYTDTAELAQFISRFMAIAYGADIIFLLIVAGALMRRFGLRYGLTANPIAVLLLVIAVITATTVQGSGATVVFVMVVATRVTDLVLSDGTSRTSLSAAYQAVPTPVRLAAQSTVEGLAVPVAIGVSGVVLMILRSTVGTDGLALLLLTIVVVAAWTVVAFFVFRDYRANLLANLRHRTLDPAELTIEGATTLAAIDRLIDSDDERDVRLGLEALDVADHADLVARLQGLATDERVGVRVDVLERLACVSLPIAAAAARSGLDHKSPRVRAASIRTLGAAGEPSDASAILACLEDSDDDVKVAAVTAMSSIGDEGARQRAGSEIAALAGAATEDDLVLAARMLGGCEPCSWIDRSPLRAMLAASDRNVVNAALGAIRWPDDQDLLNDVVGHLDDRHTARAAVDALAGGGEAALVVADDGLHGHLPLGRHGVVQLARVCRVIGDARALAVLRRHVAHRDREVGLMVMTALAALVALREGVNGPSAPGTGAELDEPAGAIVVRGDLEHAAKVLQALLALEDVPAASLLRSALRDELELLRDRVLAGLSIRYGVDGLNRVAFQLAQSNLRFHALALEWLDVTLVGTDRAAVALLEPALSMSERLRVLARWFPIRPTTPHAVLLELAEDRDGHWRRPWITACVLLTAADMPELGIEALAGTDDHTRIVHETLVGIGQRQTARHA
jgi:HEAT repeat protein